LENYIFGIRPLIEALQNGERPEKVLLQQGLQGDNFHELFHMIRSAKIPFQLVPAEKLHRLTRKNHQGVVAYISQISYSSIYQVLPKIYEEGGLPLLVIIDRVTDVRNLGAIARSAECFGAHALVIPEKGSAPVNADAIKTSAGALLKLPVCREPNLLEAIAFLKESGVQVIAATEKASKPLNQCKLSGPVAFVMGSEDKGLSKAILTMADESVAIPITGNIQSLNVAVAAGILLYEACRQRTS